MDHAKDWLEPEIQFKWWRDTRLPSRQGCVWREGRMVVPVEVVSAPLACHWCVRPAACPASSASRLWQFCKHHAPPITSPVLSAWTRWEEEEHTSQVSPRGSQACDVWVGESPAVYSCLSLSLEQPPFEGCWRLEDGNLLFPSGMFFKALSGQRLCLSTRVPFSHCPNDSTLERSPPFFVLYLLLY